VRRERARATRGTLAAVALLVGVTCAGLAWVFSATESHAYTHGPAPQVVHLSSGRQYLLSVPGGYRALVKRANVLTPQCTYTPQPTDGAAATLPLAVEPFGADTKATNAVGSFVAPMTGDLRIECLGWGAVYVDDADDSSFDMSTLLVAVASVALFVAVGLGLSALRGLLAEAHSRTNEDEDIERLVRVVHVRSEDGQDDDPGRGQ
jgi:hypothetical protein